MAGLSELDYEKFPQGDQVMNRIMSPMSVVQQAWDQINRDKQNQLKEQYNQEVLGDLQMRNPLERMRKLQEIQNDEYKGSPEYQEGMRNTIQGQGMSNLSAGQTASVLQPFKEKASRSELQQGFQQSDMRNQIAQVDQALGMEGLTPQQRSLLGQERTRLTRALADTPEHLQKMELKERGLDSAEYIARMRAAAANKGPQDPKTAEAVIAGILAKKRRGEQLSDEDVEAYNLASGVLDAKAAPKVQEGTTLSPDAAPGVLIPKKPQVVTPKLGETAATKVSDQDLLNKYLPKK